MAMKLSQRTKLVGIKCLKEFNFLLCKNFKDSVEEKGVKTNWIRNYRYDKMVKMVIPSGEPVRFKH